MLASRTLLVVAVVAALLGLQSAPPAAAHGSGTIIVPRLLVGDPTPRLDGDCDSTYRRSGNARTIQFQPRYPAGPATFRVIATRDTLWVCVENLPRGAGDRVPYVAAVLDTDHDGGSVPRPDDHSLALFENGNLIEYQGNGTSGFTPLASRGGWNALVDVGELTWSGEFQIFERRVGHMAPGDVVGFQMRENSLAPGAPFAWPAGSTINDPNGFGDLFFTGSPEGAVRLDAARITQGDDFDWYDGVSRPFNMVAGKDTLVRTRLSTAETEREVVYGACTVQRVSPTEGTERLLPLTYVPSPLVNPTQSGLRDGTHFDCWVPGTALRDPGTYRFGLQVRLRGGLLRTFAVGTREVLPSRALRVLVLPWAFPEGHAEHLPWNDDLTAAGNRALVDVARLWPIPSGLGPINLSGSFGPNPPGLRFQWAPAPYVCAAIPADDDMDATVGRCDAAIRNNGDLMARDLARRAAGLEAGDGHPRDRVDLQITLVSTPRSGGGQSCHGGSRSAGAGLDTRADGPDAIVIAQELEHCDGLVNPLSPHSNGITNPYHSRNERLLWSSAVNTVTRQDMQYPIRAVMHATFNQSDMSSNSVNEGYDWNGLRQTREFFGEGTIAARTDAAATGAQLELALIVDHDTGDVTVTDSALVEDSPLKPDDPVDGSDWKVVFVDGSDDPVGDPVGFAVPDTEIHGQDPTHMVGVVLDAAIPDGAAGYRIEDAGKVKAGLTFSAHAPAVSDVDLTPKGDGTSTLSWSATDADAGDELRFQVFLDLGDGGPRRLVASGLTDPEYGFDPSIAPASEAATLIVLASDGYNTGEGATGPFTIDAKPPVVSIAAPQDGATVVQGQPVRFVGSGFGYTGGSLPAKSMSWKADGAVLGTGPAATATFQTAGKHLVSLVGTAPSTASAPSAPGLDRGRGALVSSDQIAITVLPDADGDGLPNGYESKYGCLGAKRFDSVADADADGLSSLFEQFLRTNPCKADTDGDGATDGDEHEFGGDARNPKALPAVQHVFLPADPVDLGSCPSPAMVKLAVDTKGDVAWSAHSDQPTAQDDPASPIWLHVANTGSPGPGTITVTATCKGLVDELRYTGAVLIGERNGRHTVIPVRLRG